MHFIVCFCVCGQLQEVILDPLTFLGFVGLLEVKYGTLALVFLLVDLRTACIAMVLDYVAHWHIDFLKHRTQVYMNWHKQDKAWWWLAAIDQLLHFATYYLLVIYLL